MAELQSLASELQITPPQLALCWLLARGKDVVPIPGTRHGQRLAENALAADIQLSQADLERIDALAGRGEWSGDRRSFAAIHTKRRDA